MAEAVVSLRAYLYDLLEETEHTSPLEESIKLFLSIAAVATVAAAALETMESLRVRYADVFYGVEILAVALFTLDYFLRWWVAPESEATGAAAPWRARLRYAVGPYGFIDLLAILPFYVDLVVPIQPDWLRVLRLLRLLKLARYAPGLPLFVSVIRAEMRPLLAAFLVMAVLLVVESGIMFIIERPAPPQGFASLPHTMWWAS